MDYRREFNFNEKLNYISTVRGYIRYQYPEIIRNITSRFVSVAFFYLQNKWTSRISIMINKNKVTV
jgi:hypothetical protein